MKRPIGNKTSLGGTSDPARREDAAADEAGLTSIGDTISESMMQGKPSFFQREHLQHSALFSNYALSRDPGFLYIAATQFQVIRTESEGTAFHVRALIDEHATDKFLYPDTSPRESKQAGFCGLALETSPFQELKACLRARTTKFTMVNGQFPQLLETVLLCLQGGVQDGDRAAQGRTADQAILTIIKKLKAAIKSNKKKHSSELSLFKVVRPIQDSVEMNNFKARAKLIAEMESIIDACLLGVTDYFAHGGCAHQLNSWVEILEKHADLREAVLAGMKRAATGLHLKLQQLERSVLKEKNGGAVKPILRVNSFDQIPDLLSKLIMFYQQEGKLGGSSDSRVKQESLRQILEEMFEAVSKSANPAITELAKHRAFTDRDHKHTLAPAAATKLDTNSAENTGRPIITETSQITDNISYVMADFQSQHVLDFQQVAQFMAQASSEHKDMTEAKAFGLTKFAGDQHAATLTQVLQAVNDGKSFDFDRMEVSAAGADEDATEAIDITRAPNFSELTPPEQSELTADFWNGGRRNLGSSQNQPLRSADSSGNCTEAPDQRPVGQAGAPAPHRGFAASDLRIL